MSSEGQASGRFQSTRAATYNSYFFGMITFMKIDRGASFQFRIYQAPDGFTDKEIVEAMNAMGYDAMALGGLDLDAPLSTVQARFEEAQFPILSANVEDKDALPNLQPYLLRQVGGHTVAIVGATPGRAGRRFEVLGLDLPYDPLEGVRRAVEEVQQSADVVLVLSSLESSEIEALVQTVPGIDAIIGVYKGGQRNPVSVPGVETQAVLHASGMLGEYLGVLTLHLDAQGQVTGFEGRSVALTDAYTDDPEMLQLMREHAVTP